MAGQRDQDTPVALTSASLTAMSREWVGQMKEAAANGIGTGSSS
jgi:hypothetical protein